MESWGSTTDYYIKAIEDFNEVIAFHPNDYVFYYGRGNAKFRIGNYVEAIEDYNKAIELSTWIDKELYNRCIKAYGLIDDYENAKKTEERMKQRMIEQQKLHYKQRIGGSNPSAPTS